MIGFTRHVFPDLIDASGTSRCGPLTPAVRTPPLIAVLLGMTTCLHVEDD
jgi:hypothetical protein